TLAFGVLGGVGSRGTKTEVSVVVNLKTGATAYYLLPDSREGRLALRAKVGPVLQQEGIPFTDETSRVAPSAPGIADQLQKLVAFRDQGVLTAEEFEKAKGRLLDENE